MIVVDTSAILAVVLDEPERPQFRDALLTYECLVGTPVVLEAHLALEIHRQKGLLPVLDLLLNRPNISIIPFDIEHLHLARHAFDVFGRGRGHPARLNFGDCMSYALARQRGLPLLYKGEDFTHTDLQAVQLP